MNTVEGVLGPAAPRGLPDSLPLGVSEIWAFLKRQPASFWLVNAYLFVEYVRPQSVWPVLDVLPWGMTTLLLALAAFLLEGRLPRLPTPIGSLLLLYAGVLVLSSIMAVDPSTAYAWWELFFSWVLVYVLITNVVNTEKRFFIFAVAFLLYSFKMSQHGFRSWVLNGFGFSSWGVTGAPGWFHNSGEFGIQMCVFLPLSVEFILALRPHCGRWTRLFLYLFPITAVGSIVATSSRGALVGAALVALWWIVRSKHRLRTLLLVAAFGAITWAVIPAEQKERFTTAGEDRTSITRIDRWKDGIALANQRPALGIGYANWGVVYGPLSHNIFIEAVAELGYSGLSVLLALIGATFVVNARTRRLVRGLPTSTTFMRHMAFGLDGALIGFIGSGFFITVLYYPYFWINLAMTVALHVAARDARRRLAPVRPSVHRGAGTVTPPPMRLPIAG